MPDATPEFYYLIWDFSSKRERILSFVKDPRLLLEVDDNGVFTAQSGKQFCIIRPATADEMSEFGIKKSIECCLRGDCRNCSINSPSNECQKFLLGQALNYIIRLESHDERRKSL